MSDRLVAIILDLLANDISYELEEAEQAILEAKEVGELVFQAKDMFGVHHSYARPLVGLWDIVRQMEEYEKWLCREE